MKFEELNIDERILRAVEDMGFEEASPIQANAIPAVLEGRDVVGQAQTGTGKTAAYSIPMLQKIDPDLKKVQAIVLCPTRELAVQVSEEIRKLAGEALKYIPQRTAYYAPLVKVSYGRITIRNQKSRWGSCSSKGNLNFNCLLMLMPPEVIDYVVVHELCHRLEMNHSERFWKEVERVLPDYKLRKKWLRENGDRIMRRMALPD